MKLHIWAATVAGGILSAVGMLFLVIVYKIAGGSGYVLLRLCDGLFPLYHQPGFVVGQPAPSLGVGNVILGLINALIEGAIIALVVVWVYNLFVDLFSKESE